MKKYVVEVHYEGCISYEIEAKDENAAIKKSRELFGKETKETLHENLFMDNNITCECVDENG